MRRVLYLLALLAFLPAGCDSDGWVHTYAEALAQAKAAKKPIFVDFFLET